MKNIIGTLLLLVLLCASSFAADITAMGGKWGIGMIGSTPSLRMNLTDNFSADLGLGYVAAPSNLSGAPGIINSLLFLNFASQNVGSGGMNAIGWGLLGRYTSNAGNVSNNSASSVGLTYGFETLVNPRIGLGALIVPVSYANTVTGALNTSTWSFFNEASIVAHIYM